MKNKTGTWRYLASFFIFLAIIGVAFLIYYISNTSVESAYTSE